MWEPIQYSKYLSSNTGIPSTTLARLALKSQCNHHDWYCTLSIYRYLSHRTPASHVCIVLYTNVYIVLYKCCACATWCGTCMHKYFIKTDAIWMQHDVGVTHGFAVENQSISSGRLMNANFPKLGPHIKYMSNKHKSTTFAQLAFTSYCHHHVWHYTFVTTHRMPA